MKDHYMYIGDSIPHKLEKMPCGGTPIFDRESGISYRCNMCFAVIGSIGQSKECKELNKDYKEQS